MHADNVYTVHLPWDVIYTVPVQEKLYEAIWYPSRHLFQRIAGQIELHQAVQALKYVPSEVTVTQLRGKTSGTRS